MGLKKRKRATGGGMKPKGPYKGNAATINARIDPNLRAWLDRVAETNGRSLSQEIQVRLKYSFDVRDTLKNGKPGWLYGRLLDADRRNSQLGAIVGEIAGRIEDTTSEPWTKNEYTRAVLIEAVKIVLTKLPLAIEPDTAKPPKKILEDMASYPYLERMKEPAGAAEMIAYTFLQELELYKETPSEPPKSGTSEDMEFVYTDRVHRPSRIRKNLGLKE